jgi:hypothetical protein
LLPLKSADDECLQNTDLGKRVNPETDDLEIASLTDCPRPAIEKQLTAPYQFFLQLLNG